MAKSARRSRRSSRKPSNSRKCGRQGGNSSFRFTNKRASKGSFGADTPLNGGTDSSVSDFAPPQLDAAPTVTFSGPIKSPIPGVEIPESPPPGMTIKEFEQLRKQSQQSQPVARKATNSEIEQYMEASRARSQTRKD
jgi:hypothetical protein